MPSIWVSDEDYETLIDIKANLEKHLKKPASFSDVVSYLMIKKQMLGGQKQKEVKNKRRAIRAKALAAAISAFMFISLMSVFQVGVVSAQETPDYQSAIVKAADNLLATQNEDGGWEWKNADDNSLTGVPSPANTRGVTAQGLLDAYKLTRNPDYLAACIKTYNGMVVLSENPDPAKHRIRGPDIPFLVELSEVTENSAYADFARTRYENAIEETGGGTATGFAEYIRDARKSQGWSVLISWDINLYIQGALALDRYYPENGYDTQAENMAEVTYDSLYVDNYFDLENENQAEYWLAFSGAMEAFATTGTHPNKVSELKGVMLTGQRPDGGFVGFEDEYGFQTTAYAIMALLKVGETNAAMNGTGYLVDNQLLTGGWQYGDTWYTEITSEATQALFDTTQTVGTVQNSNTGINYITIQEAIDAASAGDTVLVGLGTYDEQVVIDKSLTLQSESKWSAIIKPSTTPPTPPYYRGAAIYITADNVTVDGFEIDGTTICNNGIYGWEISGLVIKNNKIHGAVKAWDGCGILLISWGNSGTVYNNLIENNEIYDTGRMGIMVMDHGVDYTVTSGNIITGNIVHDVWEVAWGDHGGGIQINVAKNCSITNNEVYNVQNGQRGIYMFGSATGNTIAYNTLRNNPIGIQLWISGEDGTTIIWGDDTPTSPQVRYNNIYNNGSGAISSNIHGTPMVMDATLNWWGDPGGPGADEDKNSVYGDNVSANVNYNPWLPRTLPTISNVSVSRVTTTTTTITWNTVLPANSWVDYGTTTAYGLTLSSSNLTTSHSLGLTGLTPSTTYHFRVRSEDAYGHMDNSGDLTFITAAPPPPPATLTVDTTPIKANVYVDDSLCGVAPRTRSLAAGTYTISFGDVLGYLAPAPEIVTLAAGETRTVTGVYKEIPPENIENQSPTYELPSITPEENTTIQIENTALTEITIQVENTAENIKITVQEVTQGTAGIAIGAPGVTYKYLNIVAENITDAQIGSVVIRFKVEKSWIVLNDIDIATITLNHYDPLTGEWVSLPTTYLSEDDTYVYFSAISPGLSIFGVSGSIIIPANFELSNLVITPSEVNVDETVTISVVVNNVGGRTGSTTVTLEINGVAVDTRSVTLDAGESTTVTFTVSEDVAGTYTVNVADLTGSFVATALPASPIVPLAVSIIIIVLAIGIVMLLWRIRRIA